MKLGNWHGNVDIMKSMATVKHTQVVLQWNKVGKLGTTLVIILHTLYLILTSYMAIIPNPIINTF